MWVIFLLTILFLIDKVLGAHMAFLYLRGGHPKVWQFVTATYFHSNWTHLSNNLFSFYVFGKVVEQEMGILALLIFFNISATGRCRWWLLCCSRYSSKARTLTCAVVLI